MSDIDFTNTIKPKSDQLNADDLVTGPITVTIQSASYGTEEQPMVLHIDGGHQPYKPGKSMRRVIMAIWGKMASDIAGKSLTLYCDPTIRFGKAAVGGIRISHMSHIDKPVELMITTTRSKRSPFKVQPLVMQVQYYDDAKFSANLGAWTAAIESGKITPQALIERANADRPMTEQMRSHLLSIKKIEGNQQEPAPEPAQPQEPVAPEDF